MVAKLTMIPRHGLVNVHLRTVVICDSLFCRLWTLRERAGGAKNRAGIRGATPGDSWLSSQDKGNELRLLVPTAYLRTAKPSGLLRRHTKPVLTGDTCLTPYMSRPCNAARYHRVVVDMA